MAIGRGQQSLLAPTSMMSLVLGLIAYFAMKLRGRYDVGAWCKTWGRAQWREEMNRALGSLRASPA